MPIHHSELRRAVVEDAEELTRLRTVMFGEMGRDMSVMDERWQALNLAHFRRRLADTETFAAFVVDVGAGVLAACAVGWLNPHLIGTRNLTGRTGYVANMSTDAAFRRQGHARRTLDALLAWMRSQGVGTVDLHATADGEALYRAAGFVEPADTALTLRL